MAAWRDRSSSQAAPMNQIVGLVSVGLSPACWIFNAALLRGLRLRIFVRAFFEDPVASKISKRYAK